MIMACGTGKTYTSLKLAEKQAGKGKRVLFLVPSLALLSQILTEWTQESNTPLHSFAVCSDSEIGNKRKKTDETVETFAHELRYPATTQSDRLAIEIKKKHDAHHMSVVFSTYHSIDVLSQAQKKHGLAEFDLVICDEAHRTTGATYEGDDESAFVRVHSDKFVKAKKRLYMTATPRIYGEAAKGVAEKDNIALYSMDDAEQYGTNLYVLTFSEAVTRDLLVDYKVIVLAMDEAHINKRLQSLLAGEENDLKVDDAAKIVGCWKALSKQGQTDAIDDDAPMQRAVAFCQVIEYKKNARVHKVSSKLIAGMFQSVVEAYQESEGIEDGLICEASHIDGSMNATEKERHIQWLKAKSPENTCRVLSNVRCLSEGVDVPALDSVLFLTPRNSQVDVVQSVGRVMRISPGKKRGYIVLPVVIPFGVEPAEALNDNRTYRVVWQVLQALRSHDDRFDAMINKLEFNEPDRHRMEVIAVSDTVPKKKQKVKRKGPTGRGTSTIGKPVGKPEIPEQIQLQFEIGEIERAIYAKVVQKCGNRHHWEDWANDIAKIANTHIGRITSIIETPGNTKEIKVFNEFAEELRDDLNEAISNSEVIEMLAQHLITKPVFDTLFSEEQFVKRNQISTAMDKVLAVLQKHNIDKEADTLERFYASVKLRAEGIENAEGKQKIIVELYDKFFRNAFPRLTERLGIVYTPVEVVDFIIHSVNDILKNEFSQTLGSKNVHIIDPFTGTGTFITRMLQSGLIDKKDIPYKYKNEIHANEIVLLAYYIAAVNIESTYHALVKDDYSAFEGICLTDSFQLYEKEDMIKRLLVDNSNRRIKQKSLQDIRVIICNPPYSAGQESANDNNQNIKYPDLDDKIAKSYVKHSSATNKNALYDSYIRAIRWASDRVGDSGVIGFVTNAGWIEGNTMDGMRKCLSEEFSSIYIFHLRGNQRTSGELSRQEGGKIFGSGSRAPIAISLFVKNPNAKKRAQIYLHSLADYLSREEKFTAIENFTSVDGITKAKGWKLIKPDKYHDWVNQRDDSFYDFIPMGDKKNKNNDAIFENYSRGVATSRDAWAYHYSRKELALNMKNMIQFYNNEVSLYEKACKGKDKNKWPKANSFITTDATKISWNRSILNDLSRHVHREYRAQSIMKSLYRPYAKQWLYFNRNFNDMIYQMPHLFPKAKAENRIICVTGRGATKEFSVLMSDTLPDLELISKSQCFPLYLYETDEEILANKDDLFNQAKAKNNKKNDTLNRRSAITDDGLSHFQSAYPKEKIRKEDIFYYTYGLLHSPEYKTRYTDNLSKELPRIPCVKSASDFWSFSKAGRKLADLHINYEKKGKFPVRLLTSKALAAKHYYVTKMKYGKDKDKSTIIYNEFITITGIPLEAYDYIVNGKAALDWIVERYCVSTHKDSGIVNDANLWATETEKNPKYIVELIQRVITVSLETMKIVNGLPQLKV